MSAEAEALRAERDQAREFLRLVLEQRHETLTAIRQLAADTRLSYGNAMAQIWDIANEALEG
jgi:hypothetical protein